MPRDRLVASAAPSCDSSGGDDDRGYRGDRESAWPSALTSYCCRFALSPGLSDPILDFECRYSFELGDAGEERLNSDASPAGAGQRRAVEVSPDGDRLNYEQWTATGSYDLMLLPLHGPGGGANPAEPLLNTPADERNASIAPNGRWIAYESNKTGQFQIYVKPFPNVNDAEYQVSTTGGRTPLFGRNGREHFSSAAPR